MPDPDSLVILQLTQVSKTFPGARALDAVDLDVRAGEVHALVGQNGSGKSTLIKILAGFHEPDHGAAATVRGKPFRLGDVSAAQAAGLRFVHQDLGLVDSLDCVDNLALGVGYTTGVGGRIAWRKQRATARKALSRLGSDFDVRTLASRLSAFERTALAVARAIHRDEDSISVLVLDEPTATMPKPEVERLFGLIRRVVSHRTAVLLVSHHLDEVYAVADRVTVLRDGKRVATRDVAELPHEELVTLMTGKTIEALKHGEEAPRAEPVLTTRVMSGRTLEGLDIELRRGEVLGIAGLDGSGREEVCGLIFGARSRSGTVTVDGKILPPNRPDLAISLGVALVPANRHGDGLVMPMSVRENLTLVDVKPFWRRMNLSRRAETSSTREWIANLSIRARSAEAPVESLSGGNQQKVVMGKWLRVKPLVLLLDEPTQGVDVAAQAELHRLIRRAANSDGQGNGAVLICSSDEVELARVCDRVLVLRDGVVREELTGANMTAHNIAQQSMRVA
jgi:ribose transport system ATP-binding protein